MEEERIEGQKEETGSRDDRIRREKEERIDAQIGNQEVRILRAKGEYWEAKRLEQLRGHTGRHMRRRRRRRKIILQRSGG